MESKTLLLDVGNSRIKWGIWQGDGLRLAGVIEHADAAAQDTWAFAAEAERAIVSNVAGPARAEQLREQLAAFGIELELASTSAEHAGVRCGYYEPERLGVDRWMAVLAASRRGHGARLVIDAGTALTMDMLDINHQHLGGYIIPGLFMMESTLQGATSDIRVDQPHAAGEAFGRSTSDAVRNGAMVAVLGAIARAAEHLESACDCRISRSNYLFTGGDGEQIAEALAMPSQYRSHLVLEGIAVYAGLRE